MRDGNLPGGDDSDLLYALVNYEVTTNLIAGLRRRARLSLVVVVVWWCVKMTLNGRNLLILKGRREADDRLHT